MHTVMLDLIEKMIKEQITAQIQLWLVQSWIH